MSNGPTTVADTVGQIRQSAPIIGRAGQIGTATVKPMIGSPPLSDGKGCIVANPINPTLSEQPTGHPVELQDNGNFHHLPRRNSEGFEARPAGSCSPPLLPAVVFFTQKGI